jgi:hypothetical protein
MYIRLKFRIESRLIQWLYKQVNNKVNAAITAVEKPLYNTRKKNGGKGGKLWRLWGLK